MQQTRLTGPLQWANGVRQRYEQQINIHTNTQGFLLVAQGKQGDGVGLNRRPGEGFQEEVMFELNP